VTIFRVAVDPDFFDDVFSGVSLPPTPACASGIRVNAGVASALLRKRAIAYLLFAGVAGAAPAFFAGIWTARRAGTPECERPPRHLCCKPANGEQKPPNRGQAMDRFRQNPANGGHLAMSAHAEMRRTDLTNVNGWQVSCAPTGEGPQEARAKGENFTTAAAFSPSERGKWIISQLVACCK
jgi:hypothetical protein